MWNGRTKPTEYMQLLQNKFAEIAKNKTGHPCEDEDLLLLCTLGPEQYGVEKEMLSFLKSNPNATLRETSHQFTSISPLEPLEPFGDADDEG